MEYRFDRDPSQAAPGPTPSFTPLIRYHPANRLGRDFVVGDLHGCRAMLDCLLARAKFDPAVDRLFSVGDLVDRGPDSMGCLALLREPWFHAVRGNHEALLLDFTWQALTHGSPLPGRSSRHAFLKNGGEWIYPHYDRREDRLSDALVDALHAVRRLPFLRVIGRGERRFHIVHAELYQAGKADEILRNTDINALAKASHRVDMSTVKPAHDPSFVKHWLWGRILMETASEHPLPKTLTGLSPTYCGHTISPGIRRVLSHVCLDTGAFLATRQAPETAGCGLTLIEVDTRQVYFTGASFEIASGRMR